MDINVDFLANDNCPCLRNVMEIRKCCHLELIVKELARCGAGVPSLHNPNQFDSQKREG